jgi:long-chain-acyl-CoA dehydrogenase
LPLPTALLLILLFAILFFFLCCLSRASELENKIAAQCLQLHGGAGYLYDTPIARAYLDARVQTIYGGSNEVLKDLIARQILAPARK